MGGLSSVCFNECFTISFCQCVPAAAHVPVELGKVNTAENSCTLERTLKSCPEEQEPWSTFQDFSSCLALESQLLTPKDKWLGTLHQQLPLVFFHALKKLLVMPELCSFNWREWKSRQIGPRTTSCFLAGKKGPTSCSCSSVHKLRQGGELLLTYYFYKNREGRPGLKCILGKSQVSCMALEYNRFSQSRGTLVAEELIGEVRSTVFLSLVSSLRIIF